MRTIPKQIIPSMVVILFTLFTLCCSRKPDDTPRYVFLLAKTVSMEIVKTPDLKKFKLNRRLKDIVKNRNIDLGLASSPLIKKVKSLTETRNALFAPGDSIFHFPVKIEKNARLSFGIAITDMYLKYRRVPITFRVLIQEANETTFRPVFEEIVFPGSTASQGWHDRDIPLKNSSREVVLRFETKRHIETTALGNDLFAYWSNPVITNPVETPKKKTKLILISLDTLRADHLDAYGYHRETSPEMVRHSGDFVTFKNCWSQWCWTRESHHSIMTGLYEVEHKVPELYPTTPRHLVTLAEVMKSRGYITAAFTGAGHVGAHTGLCKGFDIYFDNEYRKRGGYELLGTWLRAKQWLGKNAENDFFLFFHTYEIHAPYPTYIPDYDKMFQSREGDNRYIFDVERKPLGGGLDRVDWFWKKNGALITAADTDVIQGYQDYYDGSIRYTNDYFLKDLFSYLKTLGIYDDTVIVILSDHGDEFFEHGRFKHFDGLYEGYIHVPLLFKFARSRYGGRVLGGNVETVDVFPTLLEALDIPIQHRVSGKSLMKWIKAGKIRGAKKKFIFSQSSAKFAVRQDNTKLLLRSRIDPKMRGKIQRIEIFDLAKDPTEQQALKVDDLSGHRQLYNAVYNRLIRKKRGIHIRFPQALAGKRVEGRIDIPEGGEGVKMFFEVGVTREDVTRFRESNKQIVFQWTLTDWEKSLILTPFKGKLKIKLSLQIDGKVYRYNDLQIDSSLNSGEEYLQLTKRIFRPSGAQSQNKVFLFGNGVSRKVKSKKYFPDISEKNLEKLKELGYIN
ncbi:MAG: sulfatase [bacterium]|nr:sulfatase [bacterium]